MKVITHVSVRMVAFQEQDRNYQINQEENLDLVYSIHYIEMLRIVRSVVWVRRQTLLYQNTLIHFLFEILVWV